MLIHPQNTQAQDAEEDPVTLQISARTTEVVEGQDGFFDIHVMRPESNTEDIQITISLQFSGDFFSGTTGISKNQ